MALERKGIPTATIVTEAFASYAQGLTRMQRMRSLPIVVIPHPVCARPPEQLRDRIRSVQDQLRGALLGT